jgi:hypothetical protein
LKLDIDVENATIEAEAVPSKESLNVSSAKISEGLCSCQLKVNVPTLPVRFL